MKHLKLTFTFGLLTLLLACNETKVTNTQTEVETATEIEIATVNYISTTV